MSKRAWSLGCVASVAFLLFTLPVGSQADTIYNNLGSGNAYDCCDAWTVAGAAAQPAVGADVGAAMPFTPSGNFDLGQVVIALDLSVGTNAALVTLNSNNGGVPGAVIESWSVTGLPSFGTCCTVQTLTSMPGLLLSNGTTYWIVAEPIALSTTFAGWNFNSTGATGVVATSFREPGGPLIWNTFPDQPLGAFEVTGTRVPEPPAFSLLGLALATLPFFRTRMAALQQR